MSRPVAFSVRFTVPENIEPIHVIKLLEKRVSPKVILSVSCYKNLVFLCSLSCEKSYVHLIAEGLEFKGKKIEVQPAVTNAVAFSIKNLPPSVSNELVSNSLKIYGKVFLVDRERFGSMNHGYRHVYMELTRNLPKRVNINESMYDILV